MARPLPELTLFLDECLGTADVAEALRAHGVRVEVFLDHFPSGTRDKQWLPIIGRRGWPVLTKDKWIRRRKVERDALMTNAVAAFVLTSGDMSGMEMSGAFVRGYSRMRKLVRDYSPPFIASLDAAGRIQMLTRPSRRGGLARED